MDCICEVRARFGQIINWSKLEVLGIRTKPDITTPNNEQVQAKPSPVYLVSSLANDGRITTELGRRIGLAHRQCLQRVWAHTSLRRKAEISIVNACLDSKLCYALEPACLNVSQRRRLDGFHAWCSGAFAKCLQHMSAA